MITLDELQEYMVRGHALMRRNDPAILYEIAFRGRTYVEIGTMWGGSAVVAGLAGCEVHCIDPFQKQSQPRMVRENWKNAGLDPYKLHFHQQYHPPWPPELEDRVFDTGLIDGKHIGVQPQQDWDGIKSHVSGYVLFHDIDSYVGIEKVFREAAETDEWEIAGLGLGIDHQYGILRHT